MNPTTPRAKVKTEIRVIHSALDSPTATNASGGLRAASIMAQIEVPRNTTHSAARMIITWTSQLFWISLGCCAPPKERLSSEIRLVVSARSVRLRCTVTTDRPRRWVHFGGHRLSPFIVGDSRRQSDG